MRSTQSKTARANDPLGGNQGFTLVEAIVMLLTLALFSWVVVAVVYHEAPPTPEIISLDQLD